MKVSIIVAIGSNNVMGKENKLPWHLPADFAYFKKTTLHHCVIMGRKTFESMQKPLKDRINIVVSTQKDLIIDGCIVTNSIEGALDVAREKLEHEAFIIGGAQLINQSISTVDKLYITKIDANFEGDTFFPEIDLSNWNEIRTEKHLPDEKNAFPYEFIVFERK